MPSSSCKYANRDETASDLRSRSTLRNSACNMLLLDKKGTPYIGSVT